MRSFHVQFTEKNLTHCHVLCTDGCFDEKALFLGWRLVLARRV